MLAVVMNIARVKFNKNVLLFSNVKVKSFKLFWRLSGTNTQTIFKICVLVLSTVSYYYALRKKLSLWRYKQTLHFFV